MTPLPFLSGVLGVQVFLSSLTGAWGDTIYLHPRWASQIERHERLYRPASDPRLKAKAIFHLLHEYGHLQEKGYYGQASEDRANHYAAVHFRAFCLRLGLDRSATHDLWRALPVYYRDA